MHIIRTSDRLAFKRCRRMWDYNSKIRQDYEPNATPKALAFGIAIHEALENYYDPKTWTWDKEIVSANALRIFHKTIDSQIDDYLMYVSKESLSDEERDDYDTRRKLGNGMLEHYFRYAAARDTNWTPKFVEIEFEVPILVPEQIRGKLPYGFEWGSHNGLEDGKPALWKGDDLVVYQGRLDALMEDEYGRYWIWDHKTAASLGSTDHLENDEQCGSYCWAIQQMLGVRIEGVIYNQLVKKVPHKPLELKKGGLSKNKQQDTTYQIYMDTITEMGLNVGDYEEFLDFLVQEGNKFFRRVTVTRSQEELRSLGDQICLEAIDMLGDPLIYPNANQMNCSWCSYRTPCLAQNDKADVNWILKENYHKRKPNEIEATLVND